MLELRNLLQSCCFSVLPFLRQNRLACLLFILLLEFLELLALHILDAYLDLLDPLARVFKVLARKNALSLQQALLQFKGILNVYTPIWLIVAPL
jgi:hypothetical protein